MYPFSAIIFKKLKDQEILDKEKMPKTHIQNLIVSYKYEKMLNLRSIVKKIPNGNVEYNPSLFPGLVFKDEPTEISVLVFSSGVIVGYGSPELVDLEDVMNDLEQYYS